MATARESGCPHADLVTAYAQGVHAPADTGKIERLLQSHAGCRELFRQLTVGRYPVIPNYTILEQVGRGGFGVVYKAVHHAKERIEALKVLFSKTPLLATYFENEVHLIARLRHPNIATLYEAQLTSPPLYYTMEFVEGQRLSDALKSRDLSLARRIEIIRRTALALHYAHGQGVVHRDIKPQNILIDDAGEPHIVDFGIAKRFGLNADERREATGSSLTSAEGPIGTLGYIAPEQARGAALDARADIYSLGALLFHCVTGEPARQARDRALCDKLLRERGIGAAHDLATVIARCVEEDPARRYPDCRMLAEDLENYLAGRAIVGGPAPSPLNQAARIAGLVVRNHPVAVRLAAVTAVAALMAVQFWTFGARSLLSAGESERTVIISFSLTTLAAIDEERYKEIAPAVSTGDRKSWRQLHGLLLSKLRDVQPLVVAMDYFFPDSWPAHDVRLVEGIKSAGVPVIVAASDFDVNGEPELAPAIRKAVHGYGAVLGHDPEMHSTEFEGLVALRRGLEDPIPSLPIAAFAATRFPDCSVHLSASDSELELRYRRLNVHPGQSRWRMLDADVIPVHGVHPFNQDVVLRGRASPTIRRGDVAYTMRIRREPQKRWTNRIIPFEDVLDATPEQLSAWLRNKAVIVGQMIPTEDYMMTADGERIFGCQIQAMALDQLLGSSLLQRYNWHGLLLRTLLWATMALLLVSVLRERQMRYFVGPILASLAATLLAFMAAIYIAAWITAAWMIELGIALCTLAAGVGLANIFRILRQRQLQVAPESIRFAHDSPELPSTILASPR